MGYRAMRAFDEMYQKLDDRVDPVIEFLIGRVVIPFSEPDPVFIHGRRVPVWDLESAVGEFLDLSYCPWVDESISPLGVWSIRGMDRHQGDGALVPEEQIGCFPAFIHTVFFVNYRVEAETYIRLLLPR